MVYFFPVTLEITEFSKCILLGGKFCFKTDLKFLPIAFYAVKGEIVYPRNWLFSSCFNVYLVQFDCYKGTRRLFNVGTYSVGSSYLLHVIFWK